MPVDLKHLIELVKSSKILTTEDQKYWMRKMETMKERDLEELEEILTAAGNVDIDKETKQYVEAVDKATELVSETAERLRHRS